MGTRFAYVDSERENIRATEEFRQMPSYPDAGYVQRINDIIVVKMGE